MRAGRVDGGDPLRQLGVVPFYAFTGCDYVAQTVQQPINGHSSGAVMLFAPTVRTPANQNGGTLASVTPSAYPAGTAVGTPPPLTLTGTNLTGVADVGLFESGNSVTGPAPVIVTSRGTPFTVVNNTITVVDVPDATRGFPGVQTCWYLRVEKTNEWSSYASNGNDVTRNAPLSHDRGAAAAVRPLLVLRQLRHHRARPGAVRPLGLRRRGQRRARA